MLQADVRLEVSLSEGLSDETARSAAIVHIKRESPRTVADILSKLGAANRTQAVAIGFQKGILKRESP